MSRGATQYIIENSSLSFTNAGLNAACPNSQYLDICFVKTEVTNADITAGSYIAQTQNDKGRVFQKNADNATWTELGIAFLDRSTVYVDENILANVTPLRKAHMEDIRTFSKFIEQVYAKRYGDTYFNSHIYTKAQLLWKDTLGLARIYMQDIADGQKNLCIEFGESSDGNFGGSKLQIAYRAAGNTALPVTILQVFAQGYKCLQHGWVLGNKLIEGNCATNQEFISVGNAFHLGIGSAFTTPINVASSTFKALEKKSARLHVNSDVGFADGVIVETPDGGSGVSHALYDKSDVQHKVSGVNYSIWDERNLKVRTINRHGSGGPIHLDPLSVDADKVDGHHTIDKILTNPDPQINGILGAIPLISLEASIGGGRTGENPNMGLNADTLDGYHYSEILAAIKAAAAVGAGSANIYTNATGEIEVPAMASKCYITIVPGGPAWAFWYKDFNGATRMVWAGTFAQGIIRNMIPVTPGDKIKYVNGQFNGRRPLDTFCPLAGGATYAGSSGSSVTWRERTAPGTYTDHAVCSTAGGGSLSIPAIEAVPSVPGLSSGATITLGSGATFGALGNTTSGSYGFARNDGGLNLSPYPEAAMYSSAFPYFYSAFPASSNNGKPTFGGMTCIEWGL